eukprot:5347808-Pleurochrysis_carterae.AAC.2
MRMRDGRHGKRGKRRTKAGSSRDMQLEQASATMLHIVAKCSYTSFIACNASLLEVSLKVACECQLRY